MKENVLAAQKMLGVMATMIALFLAVVDGATVSTVLPAIRDELDQSALYSWIMSAFQLPVASSAGCAE
ncbi:hypothetical protein [Serratia rubidaea]|uniref:hypothetical protein n=1 Tax=Serratia rubidaea TaxID=61652 RepID=UPI000774AEB0|nr:hypothetical protein [Serratia rubidaea]AML55988.1 hypothetical protein AXX16_0230 [Serratia rubidaea]WBF45202.1 hypothetical protein OLD77_21730 [Serratia rubidaea]